MTPIKDHPLSFFGQEGSKRGARLRPPPHLVRPNVLEDGSGRLEGRGKNRDPQLCVTYFFWDAVSLPETADGRRSTRGPTKARLNANDRRASLSKIVIMGCCGRGSLLGFPCCAHLSLSSSSAICIPIPNSRTKMMPKFKKIVGLKSGSSGLSSREETPYPGSPVPLYSCDKSIRR